MANKVIPIRKAPLRASILAVARRTRVVKAGDLEIALEFTAEARPSRRAAAATSQSKLLPMKDPAAKGRGNDSGN